MLVFFRFHYFEKTHENFSFTMHNQSEWTADGTCHKNIRQCLNWRNAHAEETFDNLWRDQWNSFMINCTLQRFLSNFSCVSSNTEKETQINHQHYAMWYILSCCLLITKFTLNSKLLRLLILDGNFFSWRYCSIWEITK